MERQTAYKLILAYNEAWINNDAKGILDCLSDNCVIIESHGPTYTGKANVKEWLDKWFAEKSRVDKWDILSFIYEDNQAFYEWDFACTVKGIVYRLSGASKVGFAAGKMERIHEYRMIQTAYEVFQ